ncbi:Organic cation/carnitine transporter 7 [Apostasia shenzhenica]|uniref:Organic cation/carnitine transporter 7 n=1 Tax=Apostasia shenzhenica TaxID=1088818 RepID=A0A2I0BDG4_9ASPA|nr:Organic cation/carnitine transporter 7 [Apostasia shenzhenica]
MRQVLAVATATNRDKRAGGKRGRANLFYDSLATRSLMGDIGVAYTVDDALVSLGFGKFQALVLVYSGIAYAAEAMELMILSFIGSAVQSEWNLSAREKSLISSVVFAGMLVGAYTWGVVSDNFGRRKGFLFTAIVTSGIGFISSFSPNYISLVIFRFVVGAGLGGGPVLFSWFLEFVPAANRGAWMVVFSFFWSIGTILEASLAWVVMPRLGWRWLLALSSLPSFLLLIFYCITPESPRYLCMKGRKSEAMQVLECMAKINKKVLPSGELTSDCFVEVDEHVENTDDHRDGRMIPGRKDGFSSVGYVKSKLRLIGTLSKLLSKKLLRSTLLLWVAFFGNVYAYYGVILLTSALNDGSADCSATKMHKNSMEGSSLYKNVFITSLAELPGLLISAVIVDRIGRKLSIASLMFATFAFLFPLVFRERELTTTVLLFGARICMTGSITSLSIYAPEMYPTSVRSTGYGAASSVGRIGGIISPLVGVAMVDSCHRAAAILLYEAVIFLAGVAVVFFPVETKGCKLKDSVENISTREPDSHFMSA